MFEEFSRVTDSTAYTIHQFRTGFDSWIFRGTRTSDCRTKFRDTFDHAEIQLAFACDSAGA